MKYFFTSINNAYIPKAITLAESLRRVYGSEAHVTCMLSDAKRDDIDYSAFDDVLTIDQLDLPVPSLEAWIFKHTVVELCTAVKPWAFKKIFARYNADTVLYMDPDTVAYSPLDEIYETLAQHPVILTPHVSVPAQDDDDLFDGEMLGCLRHGVFNLGFLALANHGEGVSFLDWWAERCLHWCYDDANKGLFTDQRWIDLAPCFFPTLHVLRHPGYNMATWNLYYRQLSKDAQGNIMVNGTERLRFFHFSGFDIGTHELMLKKHAPRDTLLHEMSDWYIEQQKRHEQERLGRRPGVHDFLADGTKIERDWRFTYRADADLIARFPRPYSETGFKQWIERNQSAAPQTVERQPTLLGKVANRIKRHPRLVLWLNQALPATLRARLKRRL
ncbi:glycosyl transferase [Bordetella genomosp. 5]|uniref:Glycosyl transferase n=1 Tax=Bordetella genomosp. 5 TaxID=1395608 RepID=A0A261TYY9_9BORD|nr:hypothetical protein [Bordetella genomosp. 5]OZI33592.1 glycosyl transferase [Bordetella genomosp. 5]OZI54928.1 hypothetical protein CAL25_00445 [Bordetella genomosp. 5]